METINCPTIFPKTVEYFWKYNLMVHKSKIEMAIKTWKVFSIPRQSSESENYGRIQSLRQFSQDTSAELGIPIFFGKCKQKIFGYTVWTKQQCNSTLRSFNLRTRGLNCLPRVCMTRRENQDLKAHMIHWSFPVIKIWPIRKRGDSVQHHLWNSAAKLNKQTNWSVLFSPNAVFTVDGSTSFATLTYSSNQSSLRNAYGGDFYVDNLQVNGNEFQLNQNLVVAHDFMLNCSEYTIFS